MQPVNSSPTAISVADLVDRIRGEYLEMPGLQLTVPQALRLWRLDDATAKELFEILLDIRFLRRTDRGAYIRADS